MKTFLKINAVIAAVGLVLAIIGFATFDTKINAVSLETISYDESLPDTDISRIDTLKVQAGFATLRIMPGDEVKLVADRVPKQFEAHISEKNGTLLLTSEGMNGFSAKEIFNDGNISVNFDTDELGCYTLYVPASINKLELDFSFGELDISGITAQNTAVNIAFSDCEIKCEVTEKLDINTAFGDTDIDLSGSDCKSFSISSGFGDCDIKNIRITGSADIDNSFGDLSLQLLGSDYDIDCDTAFGSSSVTGASSNGKVKADVSNGFGNVSIRTVEQ